MGYLTTRDHLFNPDNHLIRKKINKPEVQAPAGKGSSF
jgi:hypothetical protein